MEEAVDPVHVFPHSFGQGRDVLGRGDIEFHHRRNLVEAFGDASYEREPPMAGQDDSGAFGLCHPGDVMGDRGPSQYPGDNNGL